MLPELMSYGDCYEFGKECQHDFHVAGLFA